jgi:hypothetical protein
VTQAASAMGAPLFGCAVISLKTIQQEVKVSLDIPPMIL